MMIRQNWKELTYIQIGGAICLPLLLIGFELGKKLSFIPAVCSCLVGNALLTVLAMAIGKLSVQERKTTSECIADILGGPGRAMASLLITISMLSWFSIQTEVIVEDVLLLFGIGSEGSVIFTAFTVFLMVSSCLYGLSSIEKLSRIATPLMSVTLLVSLVMPDHTPSAHAGIAFTGMQQALLVIVGGTIMAVIDLPTFFRTAHSEKDVKKAAVASFLVGVSLVEIMGVYLATGAGDKDLMQSLLFSSSVLWTLWVALFIFLAGWTTNVANLYSASMALTSLIPKVREKQAVLILGAIGMMLSQMKIVEHMGQILEVIAVTTIALGAELARVAFVKVSNKQASWTAVLFGTLLGIGELCTGYAVLGSSLIDVFVVTLVLSQLLQNNLRCQNEHIV